jgi:hypothetical protein
MVLLMMERGNSIRGTAVFVDADIDTAGMGNDYLLFEHIGYRFHIVERIPTPLSVHFFVGNDSDNIA